jgi:hypothetical protein
LLAVADNATVWRWANIVMGTASCLLVAGLTVVTTILEESGERVLSRLGLVAMLMAAVLWLAVSAFRAVVTVEAARETVATGVVPTYFEPLSRWAFVLFYVYAIIGFLALAACGTSVLRAGLVATWAGWSTVVFSVAMLALLFAVGDTLPAFHYVPPLLIGILLVRE